MAKAAKPGKQRTRSVAKKRMRRTNGGNGKVVVRAAAHNHLLLQKSKNNKSRGTKLEELPRGESQKAQKMGI